MSRCRRIGLSLALWGTAAGCGGDPREASDANFERALAAYSAEHPMCLEGDAWEMPTHAFTDPTRWLGGYIDPEQNKRELEALAAAGLVSRHPDTPNPSLIEYRLTPEGEAAYRTYRNSLGSEGGALCFGTPHVEKIVRYSEPADLFGQQVSEVTYRYTLQEVATWAEDPDLQRAFPHLAEVLAAQTEPAERKASLVLNSDGWSVIE